MKIGDNWLIIIVDHTHAPAAPNGGVGCIRQDDEEILVGFQHVIADHRNAPVNALGYLRVMFSVDDVDETLARLRSHGAELVGELVQYEDKYRLCYLRGPEGILIGLAEEIG